MFCAFALLLREMLYKSIIVVGFEKNNEGKNMCAFLRRTRQQEEKKQKMVEAAGIKPASASPPALVLHA